LKPPESLVVFVDRSLGKKVVANALRISGYSVEIHDDHFPPDAPDYVWLNEVSRRGWIVLTKDKKIRHRAGELLAVKTAKSRVFTLSGGSIQGSEMAQIFLNAMPKIVPYASENPGPFIVQISRTGKLLKLYP
jgi:predicted nuclease of predicted toxin-antitoxin system